MKKSVKRLLSVILSFVLILTSITVTNKKVNADPIELNVTATVRQDNDHQLDVSWTNPEEVVADEGYTFGYYVNEIGTDNYCIAANDWNWSTANPSEIRTALDTVKGTNGGIKFTDGGDYNIIVVIYKDGEIYAQGTSNTVSFEEYVNTNTDAAFKVDRYEEVNTVVSSTTIGGANTYRIFNADTNAQLAQAGENATWTYFATPTSTTAGETYNAVIKAYDKNGDEIAITNNTITLNKKYDGTEPEGDEPQPDENKVDKIEGDYSLIPDKTEELSSAHTYTTSYTDKGVWFALYDQHTNEVPQYHNERTNCKMQGVEAFVFHAANKNAKSVWVSGTRYANDGTLFNQQGDCYELATSTLSEGDNVITIYYEDATTLTFGINVAAPFDPESLSDNDWIEVAGSTNVKYYIPETDAGRVTATPVIQNHNNEECIYVASNMAAKFKKVLVDGVSKEPDGGAQFWLPVSDIETPGIHTLRMVNFYGTESVTVYLKVVAEEPTTSETVTEESTTSETVTEETSEQVQPTKPAKPVGLNVTHSYDNGGFITIAFSAATATEGATYDVYIDRVGEDETKVGTITYNGGTLADSVTGVTPGVAQYIRIVAVKDNVESESSDQFVLNFEPQVTKYTVNIDGNTTEVEENGEFTLPNTGNGFYDANKGDAYKPGEVITVTDDITLNTINVTPTISNGASIKVDSTLDKDSAGYIRFKGGYSVNNDAANADTDTFKAGIVITTLANFNNNEDSIKIDSGFSADIFNNESSFIENDTHSFYGALSEIKSSGYAKLYIAKSYVAITYHDGTQSVVYSEGTSSSDGRSISSVASMIINTPAAYNSYDADGQALLNYFAQFK